MACSFYLRALLLIRVSCRAVLGDVNGQFVAAFKKLAALHAKNTFSFAIVAGNLFAEDDDAVADLLAEKIEVAFPTYFTVGTAPLPPRIVERLEKEEDVSTLDFRQPL